MVRTASSIETGTVSQRLGQMVEWYLVDRSIDIVFRRNDKGTGRYCPEFDILYLLDGRLITERGLSMHIMAELMKRNTKGTLPQIVSCMTEQAWRYYVSSTEYPEWLLAETVAREATKRPRGRPRKLPRPLAEATSGAELEPAELTDE